MGMRRVTIQQIADLAGVSKFAVSRALSGKSGVSEQTREMILKAAGQLGYFKQHRDYIPDGESTAAATTGSIVILFPNIRYQNHDSVYWGPIFDGISSRLNEKGLDIITLTEPSSEKVFSLLNPTAIQGIITLGMISTQILLEIKRLNIPTVMVDHADPAFHCDTVFVDNFACMRELTIQLISKGQKRFQFVGGLNYSPSFYDRWLGFRSALEEFQIPYEQHPRLVGSEVNDELYYVLTEVVDQHLADAYVCANDFNAVTTIQVLREKGIEVPGNCTVTGFDNTYAHEIEPPILTVDVNKELLGIRAVDKLLWRIANRDSSIEKTLIYSEVVRGSIE